MPHKESQHSCYVCMLHEGEDRDSKAPRFEARTCWPRRHKHITQPASLLHTYLVRKSFFFAPLLLTSLDLLSPTLGLHH